MGQKALNPEEIDNAIAQVIADAIREQGVTAIKISQLSGVPRSTLSDLLRGKRAFYVQQFQKISRALGIPAHDLYRRAEALLSTSTISEPEPVPTPVSSLDSRRDEQNAKSGDFSVGTLIYDDEVDYDDSRVAAHRKKPDPTEDWEPA